jgi:D-ribose pyranase
MKRTGIQHNQLSQLVARMGHGDMILIGDVGCPFPRSEGTVAIDLAITDGIPKVEDVLKAILGELVVESYIVSQETKDINPEHYKTFTDIIKTFDNKGNPITETTLPHLDVKDLWVNGATKGEQMRAFVRTAERSPYAYIILVAGVDF